MFAKNILIFKDGKLIILITMRVVFNNQSIHSQIQEDKVLHFAAGAVSGAAGALIASKISKKE